MRQAAIEFHEADAFMLPGQRPNVQWSVARNICYWSAEMQVEGRTTTRTTLSHRPEAGDARLAELEANHFHE